MLNAMIVQLITMTAGIIVILSIVVVIIAEISVRVACTTYRCVNWGFFKYFKYFNGIVCATSHEGLGQHGCGAHLKIKGN
jgi:hypothetical protein